MFTFKKCSKRLKRMVCVALCLIVLSSLLVVPAGAADFVGNVSAALSTSDGMKYCTVVSPSNSGYSSFILNSSLVDSFNASLDEIAIAPGKRLSGVFSAYYSFLFYASSPNVSIQSPNLLSSDFSLVFQNVDGAPTQFNNAVDVTSFPVTPLDGYSYSKGYALKVRAYLDDSIINVSRVSIYNDTVDSKRFVFSSPNPFQVSYSVPSVVYILSDSATDLDALEGIADGIVAQSQVMSQYYGDIMQLLNDLYTRLGSLQSVQETANGYFAQLIPLVNSISTNTANIHSLLQTQFQLLRTLIATESGNIQDAIDQQTEDLIAYFDTVLSGSIGNMPEKSDDLESSVGNFNDAESEYQSNASQRFNELSSNFSGFSGGTLAGITLAATLFTRVWNALGEYNIVYYFPLLLGLSLVIIGRLPRGSGGQSSAEKHRGDSSA